MKRIALALVFLAGCAHAPESVPAPEQAQTNRVPRDAFNRLAAELALPIFWTKDANADGALEPGELALYWGLDPNGTLATWVDQGRFTQAFEVAYEAIAARFAHGASFPSNLSADEVTRRKLVLEELGQGRTTLVATDLRNAPADEQRFVGDILKIGAIIDHLYAEQLGTAPYSAKVPKDDAASHAVFFRNHGFRCTAPRTQDNPACSAIPDPPKTKLSGTYPEALLQAPDFCDRRRTRRW